jgi:hypothetical protein
LIWICIAGVFRALTSQARDARCLIVRKHPSALLSSLYHLRRPSSPYSPPEAGMRWIIRILCILRRTVGRAHHESTLCRHPDLLSLSLVYSPAPVSHAVSQVECTVQLLCRRKRIPGGGEDVLRRITSVWGECQLMETVGWCVGPARRSSVRSQVQATRTLRITVSTPEDDLLLSSRERLQHQIRSQFCEDLFYSLST